MMPAIAQTRCQLVSNLVTNDLAYADVTGLAHSFKPRRNVHTVTVDVIAVNNDVSEVDAYPKFDKLLVRRVGVTLGHPALDIDRATHRSHDAWELDQSSVTGP
jgi:hypothetical protein